VHIEKLELNDTQIYDFLSYFSHKQFDCGYFVAGICSCLL